MSGSLQPVLAANDANMVNLETAVGASGSRSQAIHVPVAAGPVDRLREAGVTVVNLANNHSLDFGSGAAPWRRSVTLATPVCSWLVPAPTSVRRTLLRSSPPRRDGGVPRLQPGRARRVGGRAVAAGGRLGLRPHRHHRRGAVGPLRAPITSAVMIHAGVELADLPEWHATRPGGCLVDAGADVVAGGTRTCCRAFPPAARPGRAVQPRATSSGTTTNRHDRSDGSALGGARAVRRVRA